MPGNTRFCLRLFLPRTLRIPEVIRTVFYWSPVSLLGGALISPLPDCYSCLLPLLLNGRRCEGDWPPGRLTHRQELHLPAVRRGESRAQGVPAGSRAGCALRHGLSTLRNARFLKDVDLVLTPRGCCDFLGAQAPSPSCLRLPRDTPASSLPCPHAVRGPSGTRHSLRLLCDGEKSKDRDVT